MIGAATGRVNIARQEIQTIYIRRRNLHEKALENNFVNEETGNPVPLYGEFVSRLPRTSPLIWQRTIPVTADDEDQLNP